MKDNPTSHAKREDSISRWVCFQIAGQNYALPITRVSEVVQDLAIESVPGAPPEVLGIANLRGAIVTVLDLRQRLHLPMTSGDTARFTVIVEQGNERYGVLVDGIADVRKVNEAMIQPASGIGEAIHADGILGLHAQGDQLLTLLDASSLLASITRQAAA